MTMSHLSPERLAALVDDTPTPIEAAHVTTCDDCTAELTAHRRLSRLSVEARADRVVPLSRFDALVPRLRAEGLVATPDRGALARRWALRVAAAISFMVIGAVAGRMTGDGAIVGLNGRSIATEGATGGTEGASEGAIGNVQRVAFTTHDDALRALMASQQTYQNAAAFLAAQDTSQRFIGLNSDAFRTRLAALDEMAAASRTALYRAPQDPLLNQYYLAFQTAREQTLLQLAASLPNTRQLGRY